MQTRINKKNITHLEIKPAKHGIEVDYDGKHFTFPFKLLDKKESKILGITTKTYPHGFYLDADYNSFFRDKLSTDTNKADISYEEALKSNKISIGTKDEYFSNNSPITLSKIKEKWIWAKPNIEIYAGSKLLDTLFFDSLELAKEYATINFPDCIEYNSTNEN